MEKVQPVALDSSYLADSWEFRGATREPARVDNLSTYSHFLSLCSLV